MKALVLSLMLIVPVGMACAQGGTAHGRDHRPSANGLTMFQAGSARSNPNANGAKKTPVQLLPDGMAVGSNKIR